MEDRAIERLTDLYEYWMPYVDSTATYPVDCVYTSRELDDIDWYKASFENAVAEQEGLWLKTAAPRMKSGKAISNICGISAGWISC